MKQRRLIETTIKFCAAAVLAMWVAQCTAQEQIRIETAAGLVVFQDGTDGEICFSFGVMAGEIQVPGEGKPLAERIATAAKMADYAGVKYPDFLRENSLKDRLLTQFYFAKCRALRDQFLRVMPERVFLELRHITNVFIQ